MAYIKLSHLECMLKRLRPYLAFILVTMVATVLHIANELFVQHCAKSHPGVELSFLLCGRVAISLFWSYAWKHIARATSPAANIRPSGWNFGIFVSIMPLLSTDAVITITVALIVYFEASLPSLEDSKKPAKKKSAKGPNLKGVLWQLWLTGIMPIFVSGCWRTGDSWTLLFFSLWNAVVQVGCKAGAPFLGILTYGIVSSFLKTVWEDVAEVVA